MARYSQSRRKFLKGAGLAGVSTVSLAAGSGSVTAAEEGDTWIDDRSVRLDYNQTRYVTKWYDLDLWVGARYNGTRDGDEYYDIMSVHKATYGDNTDPVPEMNALKGFGLGFAGQSGTTTFGADNYHTSELMAGAVKDKETILNESGLREDELDEAAKIIDEDSGLTEDDEGWVSLAISIASAATGHPAITAAGIIFGAATLDVGDNDYSDYEEEGSLYEYDWGWDANYSDDEAPHEMAAAIHKNVKVTPGNRGRATSLKMLNKTDAQHGLFNGGQTLSQDLEHSFTINWMY